MSQHALPNLNIQEKARLSQLLRDAFKRVAPGLDIQIMSNPKQSWHHHIDPRIIVLDFPGVVFANWGKKVLNNVGIKTFSPPAEWKTTTLETGDASRLIDSHSNLLLIDTHGLEEKIAQIGKPQTALQKAAQKGIHPVASLR